MDTIQAAFNAGELSPRMLGRVDNKFYYNGLQSCLNFIPFIQGGLTKRTGTVFVSEVKTSANFTRLIPFQFSTTQNYILEFGNLYFRVYRNRSQVVSGPPVEFVTPWTTADLRDLKFTQSADVLYIFHPNYNVRKISRTSDTVWTVTTPTFKDGPYMDVNLTTTTLTPSATSGSVTITASSVVGINGGSGFLASDIGRLIRIKHTSGSTITWGNATITAVGTTTSVTATVNTNFSLTTASVDWRLGALSTTTGFPSVGTFYEQRLVLAGTISQPQTIWGSKTGDFENFGPTSAPVPPGTGNNDVADDDGYNFTISDDKVNAIRWLVPGNRLDIGTSGSEHNMFGGNTAGTSVVTPTNINIKRFSPFGSVPNVLARRLGGGVLFVTESRQTVGLFRYVFQDDSYDTKDITLLSNHIFKSGIVDFDVQFKPSRIGWFVLNDGTMVSLTYDQEQEVNGFTRQQIGGSAIVESVAVIPAPDRTNDDVWIIARRTIGGVTKRYIEYISEPFFESNGAETAFFVDSGLTYDGTASVTVTPGATSGSGVTFTAGGSIFTAGDVGKQIRSLVGNGKATITAYSSGTVVTATITQDFPNTSAIAAGNWAIAVKTFSGIGHLEGETVVGLGDFSVMEPKVVTSGEVEYDQFYAYANIGYAYNAELETMPEEVPQAGTIQGKIYRINRFFARILETTLLRFRNTSGNYQLMNGRSNTLPYGISPPLVTGLTESYRVGSYKYADTIELASTDPTPCTILFLVKEFVPST